MSSQDQLLLTEGLGHPLREGTEGTGRWEASPAYVSA